MDGPAWNLCFYPDDTLGGEVFLPVGAPWEVIGSPGKEKGFEYKDPEATEGGIAGLKVGTGVAGKTKVGLKATGALNGGAQDGLSIEARGRRSTDRRPRCVSRTARACRPRVIVASRRRDTSPRIGGRFRPGAAGAT